MLKADLCRDNLREGDESIPLSFRKNLMTVSQEITWQKLLNLHFLSCFCDITLLFYTVERPCMLGDYLKTHEDTLARHTGIAGYS